MRIGVKIVCVELLVAIVGVGAIFFSVRWTVEQLLQNETERRQIASAEQLMREVDQRLAERWRAIQLLADNLAGRWPLTDRSGALPDVLKNGGEWEQLLLIDDQQRVSWSSTASGGEDLRLVSELRMLVLRAEQGVATYSDVFRSAEDQKLVLAMASPIRQDGRVVGVLISKLDWRSIAQELSTWEIGQLYLFNQSGQMLISSRSYPIEGSSQRPLVTDFSSQTPVRKAYETGDSSTVSTSLATQIPVLASHVHESGLAGYAGNNWLLVLETPLSEVYAPFAMLVIRLMTLGLPILALIIITVLWALYRMVIYPLQRLTKSTLAVAQGDLQEAVRVQGNDEIGILSQSFNNMVQRIREMMKEVRAKTSELQVHKELKRRYVYMSSLQELLTKLTYSTNVRVALQAMAAAMRKLSTNIIISYLIAGPEDPESEGVLYVDSPSELGVNYGELAQSAMRNFMHHFKEVKHRGVLRRQLEQPLHLQLERGTINRQKINIAEHQLVLPVITVEKQRCLGIFHVSVLAGQGMSDTLVQFLKDLTEVAALNIGRIESLVESEHSHIRDLIHSMTNGVAMFDQKGVVVIANPVVLKLVGNNQYPFPLARLGELFNQQLPTWEQLIAGVLQDGTVHNFPELNLEHSIYEMFLTPVRDAEQNIIGGGVILHDITHMKEVERMKTDFVSLASHQLRTPLTIINWYLEMLRSGDVGAFTSEQNKYLDEVYSESKRMVQLVNDLLNVSRIETGRLKIDQEPVDLEAMLREIIQQIQSYAESQHCNVEFQAPAGAIPKVLMDTVLMRQVFHNLLANAIEYTPALEEHNIQVELTLSQDLEKHGERTGQKYAMVKIKDHGIGISKEAHKQIFSKFYRAENARSVKPDGTGLGLYLAKSIVELSRGHIWFDSVEGQGTTFFVELPLSA